METLESGRIIQDLAELRALGKELLKQGWRKFALYGDLGAGKTAFVKEMGAFLGVEESIQSPTFALLYEYELKGSRLYHFDLYRLNDPESIFELGFDEYWEEEAYQFIEWPEVVQSELPADFVHLLFHDLRDGTRKIQIQRKN